MRRHTCIDREGEGEWAGGVHMGCIRARNGPCETFCLRTEINERALTWSGGLVKGGGLVRGGGVGQRGLGRGVGEEEWMGLRGRVGGV